MTSFKTISFNHQRVFLRVDLNVRFDDSTIINDMRLKAILPTINYIQEQGGKVVLATHIGRPPAQSTHNYYDPTLSTEKLLSWFKKHNYTIDYEPDIKKAEKKSFEGFSRILLLENLRFFNGEQMANDAFAEKLALLADLYVNDAFGALHRNDASITLLPQHFDKEKRAIGLLVEKEIAELSKIKEQPAHPFVTIIGGNKLATKLPLIKALISKPENMYPSTLVITGTLAYTFLQVKGIRVGKSPLENSYRNQVLDVLKIAKEHNIRILLPLDHVLQNGSICNNDTFPDDAVAYDIGPRTIAAIQALCHKAKTIFLNGTMGKFDEKSYARGTRKVIKAVAESQAYSLVGGGDAVTAVHQAGVADKIDFISTGGGATLAFLAAEMPEQELPGFAALRSD